MIIALTGYMGSGKNTAADIIRRLTQQDYGYGQVADTFVEKAFATGVRKVAHLFLPYYEYEFLFTNEFKATTLIQWNMTGREFLQKIGTEAIRDGLHKDAWVNLLMNEYRKTHTDYMPEEYPNWIITDMRFLNELVAVDIREGITIRIIRNHARVGKTYKHTSETALDGQTMKYTVFNDGTLAELEVALSNILKKENIIHGNQTSNTVDAGERLSGGDQGKVPGDSKVQSGDNRDGTRGNHGRDNSFSSFPHP